MAETLASATKLALGLFHFNVHEVAGEPAAHHRYCTQVVLPFLDAIASRTEFRATLAMAGNGLEFLADHYPMAIDLLQELIAKNKIELISSTYAPTLWVAFPGRDLEQSIKLNKKVLERLKLPASRIFFAREGFFGPGLEAVSDWFDIALCKDDTLRMFANGAAGRPVYRLGKLTVVVGANHLLHELAAETTAAIQEGRVPEFSSFYEAHLQDAVNSGSQSAAEYVDGAVDDTQWHWYHMGSAHHFTTTGAPRNWEAFFCDPDWMTMTSGMFDELLAKGYHLSLIREFAHRVSRQPIEPLPTIIESGWNPKRSRGVYAWMGRQEHRWQVGGSLLTLAWRARKALRQSELAIQSVADARERQDLQEQIDEIWKQQVLAESSGPFGSSPLPSEVNYGREQADRVVEMCAALTAKLHCGTAHMRTSAYSRVGVRITTPTVTAELIGAEGGVEWRALSETLFVCEARFRVEEHLCGVRFKRECDLVTYCPSGCEQQTTPISLNKFPDSEFCLPLANGLLSLRDDLHLVRDNCTVAVAAHLSKKDQWVKFVVEGVPEGRMYQWRFFAVCGSIEDALCFANKINSV